MRVAVLGATGAVGREMIKMLEERNFPVTELVPLASAKSAGSTLKFAGTDVVVREAKDDAFQGCDFVFGAAKNPIAERFAPAIVKAGAVFIDNSSAFRMDPDVPLVVPEVNPEDAAKNKGIIANPNCSTIITVTGVNALNALSPITEMIVSTYQAASGAGQAGPVELLAEIDACREGKSYEPSCFRYPLAYNVIPEIGSVAEEDYTTEEMKLQNEGRKIMHLPKMNVSCTCVRVPVLRSHSISAVIRTEEPISVGDAKRVIASAPGCRLVDDIENHIYPMPLDTSDQDLVYVGRIRKDLTSDRGLALFIAGDQIRKGAATNAVQIGELLL
ncbi:MAG: aspartate-semialdehyde dehydrogenase [Lachnospiraceae bacterium]|nr:aspartate-semialdehyde dehydrogenase [Lachnospiraceae bacterium]